MTKFDPMLLAIALSVAGCAGAAPPFAPGATDRRLLLEPSALAVLSDAREGNALPGAVTFGGAREQELLLVSFEHEWARSGNVRLALLHLRLPLLLRLALLLLLPFLRLLLLRLPLVLRLALRGLAQLLPLTFLR